MTPLGLALLLAVCCWCVAGVEASPGSTGLTWCNWDVQQCCTPLTYTQPASEADIIAAVQRAAAEGQTVKVVGAGHSFSPIALSDGGYMLNLDLYSQPLSVDTATGLVTVQSGMRLYALNSYLESQGLALPNLGAISQQSVAGATQTGTHGTGNTGSISYSIAAFRLVLANGTVIECDADTNSDVFAGGRVGLGALGVLSTITFQTVPLFRLRRTLVPYDLDTLIAQLPALLQQYDRLQWYWTPYTSDATLLLREETHDPITGCWPNAHADAATHTHAHAHAHAYAHHRRAVSPSAANTTCVDVSYKALTAPGDDTTLYTETEQFVPIASAAAAVSDFRAFQESVRARHNTSVSLFTGVRYVTADDMWLSPVYGRDIAVISMIVLGDAQATGSPAEFDVYAQGLQQVVAKYGGRPHWGKRQFWNAAQLAPLYPRWTDFQTLRNALDPDGVFVNAYLEQVLGL